MVDDGQISYDDLLKMLQERDPPVQRKPALLVYTLKPTAKTAVQLGYPQQDDYLTLQSHDFNRQGEVALRLPPGSYRLSPSVPGVRYAGSGSDHPDRGLSSGRPKKEFVLAKGDADFDFEFHVSTEATQEYRLKAVLADNREMPLADVEIMVQPDSHSTFRPIRLTTDTMGVATIRRSTRPLTYWATNTDRKLGASEEWLKLDPNTSEVTILMRPTRKATGRFLDKSGKPLVKCRVVCRTTRTMPIVTDDGSSARLMLSNDPRIEMTTDDQGRFEIKDLIPGVGYEITAWKWLDEYERSMRVAQKEIDVSMGEPTETIECGDIRGRY